MGDPLFKRLVHIVLVKPLGVEAGAECRESLELEQVSPQACLTSADWAVINPNYFLAWQRAGAERAYARIAPDNHSSISAFQRAGFHVDALGCPRASL
jgi:hypothetical protein